MSPDVTAARELALLCRLVNTSSDRESLELLLRDGVDWDALIELASIHALRPHLCYGLERRPWIPVPSEAREYLENFRRLHMASRLNFAASLVDVAKAFSARGIRFAVLKGIPLAVLLYGDISRRESNDIDIIVRDSDRVAAGDILERAGYVARYADRTFRESFLRYQQQYMFVKEEVTVDLHWGFVFESVPFPLLEEEIWERLTTVRIGNVDIPILCPPHQALYLAGHGAKEAWRSLGWICDFADLVRINPDTDWPVAWRSAATRKCGRPFLLACELAARLFDVRPDPELSQAAARDAAVQRQADEVMARLGGNIDSGEPLGDNVLLCETLGQKACLFWSLMTTRTTGDYQALPLKPALWPLYYVIRPIRLVLNSLSGRRVADAD